MFSAFLEKYKDNILGVVSCFDRIIISGTMPGWRYPGAMKFFLLKHKIKFVDYTKFAKSVRDKINAQMETLSAKTRVPIIYIRSPRLVNKENTVKKIISEKNLKQGIVAIFSIMESCDGYQTTWNKITHTGDVRARSSKCLHYYLYFLDKYLGLCFIRIPTWLPCKVQLYFNGHNLLAYKLRKNRIMYILQDNVFTYLSDFQKAQKLSDKISAGNLHSGLKAFMRRYLPVFAEYRQWPEWTFTQAEYATDIVFKDKHRMKHLYDELILRCIHLVKPGNIATFFNRSLAAHYEQEVTTHYNKMIHGTRVKHAIGANSVKMYDKAPGVLRIETTVNNIKAFRIYRMVKTRQRTITWKKAEMKKSIYSIHPLRKECTAVNSRYLDFLASFDDTSAGRMNLEQLSNPLKDNGRSVKGINFFDKQEQDVLIAVHCGSNALNGIRNKTLRENLGDNYSSAKVSRILTRLRKHNLIEKVPNTHCYHLTKLGLSTIPCGLYIRELELPAILSKVA